MQKRKIFIILAILILIPLISLSAQCGIGITGQVPTIELDIYEGPDYSKSDDMCYYRVEAVVTGMPDVVENVSKFGPDMIILDVIFPEDHSAGFKIARALKSDDKLVKIPIIMLSAVNEKGIFMGRVSDHDIDQSWLPVNKFLDKPVQPKELLQLVKSVLGNSLDSFFNNNKI